MALVRVHEYGGWLEANILQAADSLSFLELNVERLLQGLNNADTRRTGQQVREKFDWMYERIQVPAARDLATPLHEAALALLEQRLRQSEA